MLVKKVVGMSLIYHYLCSVLLNPSRLLLLAKYRRRLRIINLERGLAVFVSSAFLLILKKRKENRNDGTYIMYRKKCVLLQNILRLRVSVFILLKSSVPVISILPQDYEWAQKNPEVFRFKYVLFSTELKPRSHY